MVKDKNFEKQGGKMKNEEVNHGWTRMGVTPRGCPLAGTKTGDSIERGKIKPNQGGSKRKKKIWQA
jgi:hypothetical protein